MSESQQSDCPSQTPIERLQAANKKMSDAQATVDYLANQLRKLSGKKTTKPKAQSTDGVHRLMFSFFGFSDDDSSVTDEIAVTLGGGYSAIHVTLSEEDAKTVRAMAIKKLEGDHRNAVTELEIARQDLLDAAMSMTAAPEWAPTVV